MQGQEINRRREAIEAAKLAVRAYAREPSDANAAEVEDAWRHWRKLQSVIDWRKPRSRSNPDSRQHLQQAGLGRG